MARDPNALVADTPTSFIKLLHDRQIQDPDAPCLYLADAHEPASTKVLTTTDLTRAIDRLSWWLQEQLPNCEATPVPKLAYIGQDDIRYFLFPLAALQVSSLCANLSLRNSLEGNEAILRASGAELVICGEGTEHGLLPNDEGIRVIASPSVNELLNTHVVKTFPVDYHLTSGSLITTQTSGSTALPKPVTVSSEGCMALAYRHGLPDWQGLRLLENIASDAARTWMGWPLSHLAGFMMTLWIITVYRKAAIIPATGQPKDGRSMVQAIENLGADALNVTPGLIQELYDLPEGREAVCKLRLVTTGGGFPSRTAAGKIARLTNLVILYGSSEITTSYTLFQPSADDWDYLVIPPQYNSIEWRPFGQAYELIVKRNEKLAHRLGVFKNFPSIDEWATKDIFEPHPSKPHHWRILGRRDDVLVFSNGSKLIPHGVEETLRESPLIRTAFVIGQGRPFPSLLVEPDREGLADCGVCDEHLEEEIWKHVRSSNQSAPGNGQIEAKQHVILTDKGPLPESTKGVPARNASLEQYAAEIDRVYERFGHLARHDINRRLA